MCITKTWSQTSTRTWPHLPHLLDSWARSPFTTPTELKERNWHKEMYNLIMYLRNSGVVGTKGSAYVDKGITRAETPESDGDLIFYGHSRAIDKEVVWVFGHEDVPHKRTYVIEGSSWHFQYRLELQLLDWDQQRNCMHFHSILSFNICTLYIHGLITVSAELLLFFIYMIHCFYTMWLTIKEINQKKGGIWLDLMLVVEMHLI